MSDTEITVLVGGADQIESQLLSASPPNLTSFGHVPTGNEAVARVLTDAPDVLLLDVPHRRPRCPGSVSTHSRVGTRNQGACGFISG